MFGCWQAIHRTKRAPAGQILCIFLVGLSLGTGLAFSADETEEGDLTVLVALIRGEPDPEVKPAKPVLDKKIEVFRKEFVALSKKLRDARFEAVDTKKVPIEFSEQQLVKLDKNMEVEITVSPLKDGKHPLKVVWYRRQEEKRIKIANSLRTAKIQPEGALVPVIFTGEDAPTLYVGVAIVKDDEEKEK